MGLIETRVINKVTKSNVTPIKFLLTKSYEPPSKRLITKPVELHQAFCLRLSRDDRQRGLDLLSCRALRASVLYEGV